jgi:hypothetical protein
MKKPDSIQEAIVLERAKKLGHKLKIKKHKARCKRVMAIIDNRIERFDTVREETYPPIHDFDSSDGTHFMVVKWPKQPTYPHIHIPLQCVIFLYDTIT